MARVTKTFPGTIYVPAKANRIYIDYTDKRTGKRKRLATGLKPTKEGFEVAETMLKKLYLQSNKILNLRVEDTQKSVQAEGEAITFRDAWAEFRRVHGANKLPKTMRGYEDAFNKIFKTYLASPLTDESFQNGIVTFLETTKLASASVNIHLRSVQVFAGYAARKGWIPLRKYSTEFTRKEDKRSVQIFLPDELHRMVNYMEANDKKDLALLVRFLCETGFRISQALLLEWSDIHNGTINRQSKDKRRNEPFPITQALQKILDAVPRHPEKPNKVFFWENSSQSSLARDLNKVMEALGIEKNHRNWHTFRKTAASLWAARGIPIQEVQKLLGHTNVEITNSYYVGVNMDTLRQKLDGIDILPQI